MQNAPLPSLNATLATKAKAANLPRANLGADNANDAFKQALSQQFDQRHTVRNNTEARAAERQAATRAAAPKPQAAPKPAQQDKPVDRSAQPKPAAQQDAAAASTGKADQADDSARANRADEAGADDRAASDARAANGADPMADMLALVAAFNQRAETGAADAAGAEAATAAVAGGDAANAADAATLAVLTAAGTADGAIGAEAAATAGGAEATAAQFGSAEFKAALGRAANALPAPDAEAGGSADAGSSLVSLRAELAGKAAPASRQETGAPGTHATQHGASNGTNAGTNTGANTGAIIGATGAAGAADAAGSAAVVNTGALPDIEPGNFGQQLASAAARGDARADADAALAAREAAPVTVAPATAAATAAAAPEMAKVAAPAATLYSRVGTPAWDQQLGQKVIFMAAGGEHSATMELNPPDLGPLQVVLSVNKDQATAAFTSAAPEVRQALEAALPRLREMMGEAGIQLGNATVSSGAEQNPGQRAATNDGNGQRGSDGRNDGRRHVGDTVDAGTAPTSRTVRLPNGAVDTFA